VTYAYEPKTPGKGRFAHMTGPGLPAYGVRYGRLADSDLVEYTRCKADNAVRAKYTWGLDLSGLAGVVQASLPASGIHGAGGTLDTLGEGQGQVGGLHGAGGIGSLLAREEPQAVGDPKRHWYLYDANGNVGQLLEYVAGTPPTVTLAAHYEYDPYGNTIHKDDVDASGIVDANLYRFSTKYFDPETDMGYWGERYLVFRLGRWANHDPAEESGGINLYAFLGNSAIDGFDPLGLRRRGSWIDPGWFDEVGWDLFWRWLWGDGSPVELWDDPLYRPYMMAHPQLRYQLRHLVIGDARGRLKGGILGTVSINSPIVLPDNGYHTGYELLHGTNENAGGFRVLGPEPQIDNCVVRYHHLKYQWGDIMDPNPQYWGDTFYSKLLFWGTDYEIYIIWTVDEPVEVEFSPDLRWVVGVRGAYPSE